MTAHPRHTWKSRLLLPVLVAAALVPGVGSTSRVAASPDVPALPTTIPAVQQWSPLGTHGFALRQDTQVTVPVTAPTRVRQVAEHLAGDLAAMVQQPVLVRAGAARPGDIALDLIAAEPRLGPEGYRLGIDEVLTIAAPTDTGLFYGTRTVLQMLRQQRALPGGAVVDWPRYPDRGLMVDAGRRHYSADFYRQQILRMSWLKLNLLHLHLSDDAGLAVDSERHPESVAPERLTKAEVREIVTLAHRHHIRVMPEIDMPGHMTGILRAHPELQLHNIAGTAEPSRLDVTNPAARAFARDLIDEYLPLFPDAEWHLGADEYMPAAEYPLYPVLATYAWKKYGLLSNGKDAMHDFVNDLASYVIDHGRTPRIWNDETGGGLAVRLDPRLVVEWWTDFNPLADPLPAGPQAHVNDGHQVLNNGWWPTYYAGKGLPAPDFRQAYQKWHVNDFYGTLYYDATLQAPPKKLDPSEPANRGSKLAVWSDGPVFTEAELLAGTVAGLRLIAQKTWESPAPATYGEFEAIAASIGAAAA